MEYSPHQAPIPTSQFVQVVLDQTETIYQDVRRNAMQAYIKHKAYYDKKTSASKLKKTDYVYVLQLKGDINGKNFRLQNFGGLAPTFLKRCYLITNILYVKLAPTRRKC